MNKTATFHANYTTVINIVVKFMQRNYSFYEFFAGAGMARAGLGAEWNCVFANEIDGKKALTYQDNWGTGGELLVCDIASIDKGQIRPQADLAWASFPCQDLSLAGNGKGLNGERSSLIFDFWNIIEELNQDGRAPKLVAIENVCGTLTTNNGYDFELLANSFCKAKYNFGAMVIDAVDFLPQSRPRLFIVGIHNELSVDPTFVSTGPSDKFHTKALRRAYDRLNKKSKKNWLWWNLPTPPKANLTVADLIENDPKDVEWNSQAHTDILLSSMTTKNAAKVIAAQRAERVIVGTIYKRTRPTTNGRIVRAEVRFDDTAGCLRTPNGGSSRQTLIVIDGGIIRTRLLSARETARLMGLSEKYKLPKNYNEAYHLTGDGVAVPVVRFLSKYLFEPILHENEIQVGASPTDQSNRWIADGH